MYHARVSEQGDGPIQAEGEGSTVSPSKQLAPLYRATFLFGTACGISLALTPLILDRAGFDKESMGTLALFFAAGLVLFSLPVGAVLRRLGPKATLGVALCGYAICVATFPFMKSYASIAGIRFLDGVFSICVWVSSETLVLARSDAKHKGHLTSLYAIWLASGYVTGPLLARGLAAILSYQELFLLAGAIAACAVVYLTRRLGPAPAVSAVSEVATGLSELSLGQLLSKIKTSCFATFSYGYFQAAVVLFLPLYLIESKGIAPDDTIILPGLFCLGMLLCSNWAARWGDRVGHLFVMTVLSTIGMGCVFGFVFVNQFVPMCVLVFLAGATLASMSPIALALTGVIVAPSDLGRANSLYNTFYASGIFLGPPVSSFVFSRYGGGLMLYHLAAMWAAFIVWSVLFSRDDPSSMGRRFSLRPGAVRAGSQK